MTTWPGTLEAPGTVAVPNVWGMVVATGDIDLANLDAAITERLFTAETMVRLPASAMRDLLAKKASRDTTAGPDQTTESDHVIGGGTGDGWGTGALPAWVAARMAADGATLHTPQPSPTMSFYLRGDPIGAPGLPVWPEPDEHGDTAIAIVADERHPALVGLPEEYWLREFLTLDIDDPATLLDFLATYGPLEMPGDLSRVAGAVSNETAVKDGLDPDSAAISEELSDLGLRPTELRGHRDVIEDVLYEWVEEWGPGGGEVASMRIRNPDGSWTVASVSLYRIATQAELLGLYQAVLGTWLALGTGPPLTAAMLAEHPPPELCVLWERAELPVPPTTFAALDTAIAVLNAMTVDYGPRVELLPDGANIGFAAATPRIRTALGLQVQAWIADGADARQCANETCRGWFIRQEGRAKYATSRRSTGLLYCSASCAQSQASREYRRRKKQRPPRT